MVLGSNSGLFASGAQILHSCPTLAHGCYFSHEDTDAYRGEGIALGHYGGNGSAGKEPVSLTFFPCSRDTLESLTCTAL